MPLTPVFQTSRVGRPARVLYIADFLNNFFFFYCAPKLLFTQYVVDIAAALVLKYELFLLCIAPMIYAFILIHHHIRFVIINYSMGLRVYLHTIFVVFLILVNKPQAVKNDIRTVRKCHFRILQLQNYINSPFMTIKINALARLRHFESKSMKPVYNSPLKILF